MSRVLSPTIAMVLALLLARLCAADGYYITDLGPVEGEAASYAYGINDAGDVVGDTSGAGFNHAFLYDGSMHNLGTLGGTSAAASAINEDGEATGASSTTLGDATEHAFLYDGTMHDLGTLGTYSFGNAINNRGEVAGYSYLDPRGTIEHAFLYDGTMHDLGTLGATNSFANGINDQGHVTGYLQYGTSVTPNHMFLYDGVMHDLGLGTAMAINNSDQITGAGAGGNDSHAFLYDGAMHDLGTLGGRRSEGLAINELGQVTGWSQPTKFNGFAFASAFIYDSVHGMRDLNSLIPSNSGWGLFEATAINRRGQIAGLGLTGGVVTPDGIKGLSEQHGFLLTPAIAGDANLDRIVNTQDLGLVASNWLATGTTVAGDANGDGIVNGQDLAEISSNWLASADGTTATAPVPEPGGLTLAVFLGIVLAVRRWKLRASLRNHN